MSMTPTLTPPTGVLGKVFARVAAGLRSRHAAAALAGMSEREYQDIGWGQADRWSATLGEPETPPERRIRAAAVEAWHRSQKKAA